MDRREGWNIDVDDNFCYKNRRHTFFRVFEKTSKSKTRPNLINSFKIMRIKNVAKLYPLSTDNLDKWSADLVRSALVDFYSIHDNIQIYHNL